MIRVIEMGPGRASAANVGVLFDTDDLNHYLEEATDEFTFVVLALADEPMEGLAVGDFLKVVAVCDSREAAHLVVAGDLGHAPGVWPPYRSVLLSVG